MEHTERENLAKRQKARRDRRRREVAWMKADILAGVLCICVLVVGICRIHQDTAARAKVPAGNEQMNRGVNTDETAFGGTAADASGLTGNTFSFRQPSKEQQRRASELLLADPELLVLVNTEQMLKEDYEPDLRKICSGRLQAANAIYDDLVALLAAAEEEGHTYWIASAYRSRARQEELMEAEIQKNMGKGLTREEAYEKSKKTLMVPGYSEHETGLALDILCSENTNLDISQKDEAGNQWLAANAYRYGFILRYPEDKVEVTKINYEPWHFRYVGREAAAFMWENDITLEEFWAWAA